MTGPPEIPAVTRRARDDLLDGLRADGARRDEAARELHALLLRAARFEIGRRSGALPHVRGEHREDLALQAADDAFVAVVGRLSEFRGESRFSTWAYKFALYEAAARVRRRAWQHREVVLEAEQWLDVGAGADGPEAAYERAELLSAIRTLITEILTVRQREVLLALTLQG